MPQELEEGKCSYQGRSWTRFGISINQEVSRGHSTHLLENGVPKRKEKVNGKVSKVREGLNVKLPEIR